jgi:hypothetical protein
MKDMKPAAKRKASRRAPAKRAKSARRPSTKSAKAAARRPSTKSVKTAARRAPVKRAKPVPAKAAAQPKRILARPKPTLIPIIAPELTVTAHKFRVGESVHLTAGIFARGGAGNVYKVTQLLPSDGDEQQYRIKSASEPHERVAKQSQLERAA